MPTTMTDRAATRPVSAGLPSRRGRQRACRRSSVPGGKARSAYLYLLPGLLLVGLFVVIPLAHTIWISFFRWDGLTAARWTGLANYQQVFTNPLLRSAFGHSLVLIVFYSLLPICVALGLTALLGRRPVRFMTAYRAVLFFPQAVALVVSGIAWQWMYEQSGVVNQVLRFFGASAQTAWLGSFTWALPAIGLIGTWLVSGLCLVLFLAGVQKINPEYYEAAQIDGASEWKIFRHITLPGLRAEIAVALTLTIVAALKSFDLVYVLTNGYGGPGNTPMVPGLAIYELAFNDQQVGLAASLGVVLAGLIFAVVAVVSRLSREPE